VANFLVVEKNLSVLCDTSLNSVSISTIYNINLFTTFEVVERRNRSNSTPAISIEINCIKMSRITNTILLVIAAFSHGSAFSTTFLGSSRVAHSRSASPASALSMRVVEIDSATAFDNTISSAGDALVVVDYSTTWCGPCKVIAPKFEEFSDKYPDAVFLKVIGDATTTASELMKREGVKSVPSFHYFKGGEKVDVVNGANADAIEAGITKHA
jgi:thioredoxin 1